MELATSYLKHACRMVIQGHQFKGTRVVTPGLHMRQAGAISTATIHRLTCVHEFLNAARYVRTDRNFMAF
jgi:hypothetical protein